MRNMLSSSTADDTAVRAHTRVQLTAPSAPPPLPPSPLSTQALKALP